MKLPRQPLELQFGPETHSASYGTLKTYNSELIRNNAKKQREEFLKNKHQRPTQLIAPIDPVDYSRVLSAADKIQIESM